MTETTAESKLLELLRKLVQLGGSDLHLTTGLPPYVRVDGRLQALDGAAPLTLEDTKALACSRVNDTQKARFENELELNYSFGIPGLSRFRASLFHQRGAVAAAFRAIPFNIRPFEELGLPPIVKELCTKPRGLLLATGPTGSGKSTTLATMVDKINGERQQHILTIEDPIEYLHTHRNCIVNQRELGGDTKSFAEGLRNALREDPDVVMVGEMRDLDSIESTLHIAETGHLTLTTLHTNSAAATINRIIDVFPAAQQTQVRTQLSLVLEGVLCQSLLPRASGEGRALALEVLIPNSAVRALIRENKIAQIYSVMQTGHEYGMQTFNQALAALYQQHQISFDTAMGASSNQQELKDLVERAVTSRTARDTARPFPRRVTL